MKVHKSHFYHLQVHSLTFSTRGSSHVFSCDCDFFYLILPLKCSWFSRQRCHLGFCCSCCCDCHLYIYILPICLFVVLCLLLFWLCSCGCCLFVYLFVCLVAWLFGWLVDSLVAFCQRWNLVVLHLPGQVSSVKMCQSESSLGGSFVGKLAKMLCLVKQPNQKGTNNGNLCT